MNKSSCQWSNRDYSYITDSQDISPFALVYPNWVWIVITEGNTSTALSANGAYRKDGFYLMVRDIVGSGYGNFLYSFKIFSIGW